MKKLGSQLTTGDVVTTWPGRIGALPSQVHLLIVSRLYRSSHAGEAIDVVDLYAAPQSVETRYFKFGDTFHVQDRSGAALTADELALLIEAATDLVKLHESGDAGPALLLPVRLAFLRDLVKRLTPPEPPTMAEVLQALEDVAESDDEGPRKRALAILDRARRAGMLPKGDAS